VTEQTRLADELGYSIAWFAEHHFSNYCLCASPLMLVAHCASVTKRIRLGTAVVVLPLYNPVRLAAEIALVESPRQLSEGIASFDEFAINAVAHAWSHSIGLAFRPTDPKGRSTAIPKNGRWRTGIFRTSAGHEKRAPDATAGALF
jgi:Luciferase-like monooxygenase